MRRVMILALLGMVAASCGQNTVGYDDAPQDADATTNDSSAVLPDATNKDRDDDDDLTCEDECANADPQDNHCNGRGHYAHGNGHGYGHCRHHRHSRLIPRAEKCVLDSDCEQRQKCKDEECAYLLPPFPDGGW